MRLLLAFIMCLLCVSVQAQRRIAVMTDTNSLVISPTNFWTAASNEINAVLGATGLSNVTETARNISINGTVTNIGIGDTLRIGAGVNFLTLSDAASEIFAETASFRVSGVIYSESLTATSSVDAASFSGDGSALTSIQGTDTAYSVAWDTNSAAPTMNSIYDYIETFLLTHADATNTILALFNEQFELVQGSLGTNTLYVSTKDGDDSSAIKGDPYYPWQTIGAAFTNAASGDTVHIKAGNYDSTNEPPHGITVYLEPGANVGTLGRTNVSDTTVTTNTWTLLGRGVVTNLQIESTSAIYATCAAVPGILSLSGGGRHVVEVPGGSVNGITCNKISDGASEFTVRCGNVTSNATLAAYSGAPTPGTFSQIPASSTSNGLVRLFIEADTQTNWSQISSAASPATSINTHLKTPSMWGMIWPAHAGFSANHTNYFTLSGKDGHGSWRNGQLDQALNMNKSTKLDYVTIRNLDWFIPSGQFGVSNSGAGSTGTMSVRLADVWVNSSSITNGAAGLLLNPNSTHVVDTGLGNYNP